MTSFAAFVGGRAGFLVVAVATHAVIGYALGAWLFDAPWAGVAGALIADLDLLVPAAVGAPFAHRGITHTPLAAGVAVAVAATRGRSVAGAVGAGYGSQLLIDLTTPRGIQLFYPLSTESVAVPVGGHSPPATLVLWAASAALLWWRRSSAAPGDRGR